MPANKCTRKESMRKTYAISKVITDSGKGNHKVSPLGLPAIVKRKAYLLYWRELVVTTLTESLN